MNPDRCFVQDFGAENDFLKLFLFSTSDLVAVDSLPEKTTLTATYYTKTVLHMHMQRPAAESRKPPSARVLIPSRPKSQNCSDRSRTSRSWTTPYSPEITPGDFLAFFFFFFCRGGGGSRILTNDAAVGRRPCYVKLNSFLTLPDFLLTPQL